MWVQQLLRLGKQLSGCGASVSHLEGGQTLLLAVPDETTEHIAKMVGTQRSNREGFNRRTGDVLASVGRGDIRKIEKAMDNKNRVVPEFMKKQMVTTTANILLRTDGIRKCCFPRVWQEGPITNLQIQI